MSYSLKLKAQAINLREQGQSLKEISQELKIAKSTASAWLSDIPLSPFAQKILSKKQISGQYETVLLKKKLRENNKKLSEAVAFKMLKKINLTTEISKLCCALVWWCEGNKVTNMIRFTSSDITLIDTFLFLLRRSFILDESKFRALIHIHKYHNDLKQKLFWSKVTKIPLEQFNNSYQKPNTAIRTQPNYPGCVAISYYDAKIAKELQAIYNSFTKLRGVG